MLERHLQTQPELALVLSGAGDYEKVARRHVRGRIGEVRRVRKIVRFSAELQIEALGNREGAEQANVRIENGRTAKDIAARVAEANRAHCRKRLGIIVGTS